MKTKLFGGALTKVIEALTGEKQALEGKIKALEGKIEALEGKIEALTTTQLDGQKENILTEEKQCYEILLMLIEIECSGLRKYHLTCKQIFSDKYPIAFYRICTLLDRVDNELTITKKFLEATTPDSRRYILKDGYKMTDDFDITMHVFPGQVNDGIITDELAYRFVINRLFNLFLDILAKKCECSLTHSKEIEEEFSWIFDFHVDVTNIIDRLGLIIDYINSVS